MGTTPQKPTATEPRNEARVAVGYSFPQGSQIGSRDCGSLQEAERAKPAAAGGGAAARSGNKLGSDQSLPFT